MKEKHVAIVLAAGRGKRMQSAVQKQYLLLGGKPVLYYSLKTFQECGFIDEIVLVTQREEIGYCQKEIVEKYKLDKVKKVVSGGAERYLSVYEGLKSIDTCDYVYIHDGARPFINEELLLRVCEGVQRYRACVAAMPVKDTIKISGEEPFAKETPDRSRVWMVQTPQVFEFALIKDAYQRLIAQGNTAVTDDAMVLETMSDEKIRLIEGSYRNIKITTPEDLEIAEVFLEKGIDKKEQ